MSRLIALVFVAVLAVGCAENQPQEIVREDLQPVSEENSSKLGEAQLKRDYVLLADLGVELRPPVGFEKSESGNVFRHPSDGATIELFSSPRLNEVSRRLGQTIFEGTPMRLIAEEEHQIGGELAMIFHYEGPAEEGITFTSWMLIVGVGNQTIHVIGKCEKDQELKLGPALKASLLSLRPSTGGPPPAVAGREDALQEEHVEFPNVGVAIQPPVDFARSESFDGFNHPSDAASIMVVQLPGPFAEMDKGFTAENLSKRGLRFIEREEREVNGQPGFLVHFAQSQLGDDYLKWSLIYGSTEQTTLITATCPQELQTEYAASLKSSLLSVRPAVAAASDPLASLSFEIAPAAPFKFAHKVANTALYTIDGAKRNTTARDPIFVVAPALSAAFIPDRRAYAVARLKDETHAKNLIPESTESVSIDGLEGFESLANAEDPKSDIPIVVYQTMLFTEDSYIVMQGLVGADQREKFVPAFKQMARSFQRKTAE